MRAGRLFRVNVEYPADAHYEAVGDDRFLDPDWEPEDWHQMIPPGWHGDAFAWPKEKIYFSRSGAEDREKLFRKYGATATVEASEPVVWGVTSWALPEQPPVGTVLKGGNREVYFRRIVDCGIDGWAYELDSVPTSEYLPHLEWINVLKHGPLTLVDGEVAS